VFIAQIDVTGLERKFRELKKGARHLKPVFDEFKPVLKKHMEDHFQRRQAEDGGWSGWSQAYLDRVLASKGVKQKRTKRGRRLLPGGLTKKGVKRLRNMLGRLKNLSFRVRQSFIEVFSRAEIAAIHQKGGTAGKGGRVHIPKREFLWVSDELVRELGRRVKAFLLKDMK